MIVKSVSNTPKLIKVAAQGGVRFWPKNGLYIFYPDRVLPCV